MHMCRHIVQRVKPAHGEINFRMDARLNGSQHITVENQQEMAANLHIYYFISAFRIPTSHKPVLTHTHTHTSVHTHTQIECFEFNIKIISPKE